MGCATSTPLTAHTDEVKVKVPVAASTPASAPVQASAPASASLQAKTILEEGEADRVNARIKARAALPYSYTKSTKGVALKDGEARRVNAAIRRDAVARDADGHMDEPALSSATPAETITMSAGAASSAGISSAAPADTITMSVGAASSAVVTGDVAQLEDRGRHSFSMPNLMRRLTGSDERRPGKRPRTRHKRTGPSGPSSNRHVSQKGGASDADRRALGLQERVARQAAEDARRDEEGGLLRAVDARAIVHNVAAKDTLVDGTAALQSELHGHLSGSVLHPFGEEGQDGQGPPAVATAMGSTPDADAALLGQGLSLATSSGTVSIGDDRAVFGPVRRRLEQETPDSLPGAAIRQVVGERDWATAQPSTPHVSISTSSVTGELRLRA